MLYHRQKTGFFVTIEGIEGAGKSTAIQAIKSFFEEKRLELLVTREPGGTEIAEAIRKTVLAHYQEVMTPETELLLVFAGRAQHIAQVIKPALAEGKIVLSDRFTDASFAYQGAGRGVEEKYLSFLAKWIQGGLEPDLTILLDVPVEIGLPRVEQRGAKDRFEQEKYEFFERVRQSYLDRAKHYPHRFRVVDSRCSKEAVNEKVIEILSKEFVLVKI